MARLREDFPVGGYCYLKTRHSYSTSAAAPATVQKRRHARIVSVERAALVLRTVDDGREAKWPINLVEPDEEYLAARDQKERDKHARLRREGQLPDLHLVSAPLTVALGEALQQKASTMPPRTKQQPLPEVLTHRAPVAPVPPIVRSTGQPAGRTITTASEPPFESITAQFKRLRADAERLRGPLRADVSNMERACAGLVQQIDALQQQLDAKRAELAESADLLCQVEAMLLPPPRRAATT